MGRLQSGFRIIAVHCFLVLVLSFFLLDGSLGVNLEGRYLLKMKGNLTDSFNLLSSWDSNDPTPCSWRGVYCSPGDHYSPPAVTSLNLGSLNLSGSLSPSVCKLGSLAFLDLSFNKLSGNLPAEIGSCSNLQSLKLNNNQFDGQATHRIGQAPVSADPELLQQQVLGTAP
ncbi:hypothetical protein SAY87_008516 [Trapa incisa]|uniref:Leucine-rich repeat-containing N-terminal plant-type domain-containing protein n=1 Tax=Trapa incisa TaxID=236973 RepID=A0AAN7PVY7_9MYRT|nr:hypothetical protein SAY87_008516 [Trapa incisa]